MLISLEQTTYFNGWTLSVPQLIGNAIQNTNTSSTSEIGSAEEWTQALPILHATIQTLLILMNTLNLLHIPHNNLNSPPQNNQAILMATYNHIR